MRVDPEILIPRRNERDPDPVLHAQYPREPLFQKAIERLLKQCGWLCFHSWSSMRSAAGFPDLLAVHPETGELVVIEIKTETGTVTEAQAAWLRAFAIRHATYLIRPSDTDEVVAVLGAAMAGGVK